MSAIENPFVLSDIRTGESLEVLELPEDYEAFVTEVIDPDTMTINLPHGKGYTLIPMNNPIDSTLDDLHRHLLELDKPNRYMFVLQQRADGLIQAVERLFSFQSRILIASKEELENYLAYRLGKLRQDTTKSAWLPTKVRRPLLGKYGAFLEDKPRPNAE